MKVTRGNPNINPAAATTHVGLTCTCPSQLIDYVRRTVGHPYFDCPYFGTITRYDEGADHDL